MSKQKNRTRWLTRLASGLLILDLLLIFLVPTDTEFRSLLLVAFFVAGIFFSWIIALTWLMIHYRKIVGTWFGLILSIVVLVLSNMVSQGILRIEQENLSLLFSLLSVVSCWVLGIAVAIFLWYHDLGLRMIAGMSAILMWILVFAWRFQGNLIELSIDRMFHPQQVSPIWWFDSLLCMVGWVVPIGFVSFLGHTLRLLIRELKV